jgi:hypothetical protein
VGGSLSGTVTDSAGKAVAGASVSVHELATGLTYQARSDASGYFTLPVLPVGRYQLEIHTPGFRTYQRKDIVLDTNAALRLDATLASRRQR